MLTFRDLDPGDVFTTKNRRGDIWIKSRPYLGINAVSSGGRAKWEWESMQVIKLGRLKDLRSKK